MICVKHIIRCADPFSSDSVNWWKYNSRDSLETSVAQWLRHWTPVRDVLVRITTEPAVGKKSIISSGDKGVGVLLLV